MNTYTRQERLKRWRNFGVIPAFVPTGLSVLFDLYLEYTFQQIISRHFLEFVLIVFAISASVFSAALDCERGLDGKIREHFIVSSVALAVLSLTAYAFLYERGTPKKSWVPCAFRVGFLVAVTIITRVGFRLEEASAKTAVPAAGVQEED